MAVLLICVGLSGCNEQTKSLLTDEEKMIGTWKYTTVIDGKDAVTILVLSPDGTFNSTSTYLGNSTYSNGTWEIIDNKFSQDIILGSSTMNVVMDYVFSNNDNTLTFTYESKVSEYTRQ